MKKVLPSKSPNGYTFKMNGYSSKPMRQQYFLWFEKIRKIMAAHWLGACIHSSQKCIHLGPLYGLKWPQIFSICNENKQSQYILINFRDIQTYRVASSYHQSLKIFKSSFQVDIAVYGHAYFCMVQIHVEETCHNVTCLHLFCLSFFCAPVAFSMETFCNYLFSIFSKYQSGECNSIQHGGG